MTISRCFCVTTDGAPSDSFILRADWAARLAIGGVGCLLVFSGFIREMSGQEIGLQEKTATTDATGNNWEGPMKIFDVSRSILAGIAFTLLPLVNAQAGSIFTPMIIVEKNGQAVCIANNVHTAPVTVTVRIKSSFNLDASKTCTLPVGDDDGCVVSRSYTQQQGVRCDISMSGLANADVAGRLRGIQFYRRFDSTIKIEARSVVRAR